MRTTTITLGDKEFPALANFSTSVQINKLVGDPLWIAREAMLENMMIERGLTYDPKFAFDVKNIAQILYIGCKAADKDLTMDTVQEAIFDCGFYDARTQAIEYIGLIIGPKPEVDLNETDSSGGKQPGLDL